MEAKKPQKHEKTSINTRDRWIEMASGRQELQSRGSRHWAESSAGIMALANALRRIDEPAQEKIETKPKKK